MNEYEKMIAGLPYNSMDADLTERRLRSHELCRHYNLLPETELEGRVSIIKELIGKTDSASLPVFQGEIFFDYGSTVQIGKNFYANYRFTVNDNGGVYIGDDVMLGSNVSLYTAVHPKDAAERIRKTENGLSVMTETTRSICIGDRSWLGGNVVILPGVHIGKDCIIGAGSVVTKDVQDGTSVAGNPARIIGKTGLN